MSDRETRVNQSLKHLVDEFRMGVIAVEDYQNRRTAILNSWYERDVTTSPDRAAMTTSPGPRAPATSTPAGAPTRKLFMMMGLAFAALVLGGYAISSFTFTHARAPETPVQSVKHAADEFLNRNRWELQDIDMFQSRWNRLSADERRRVISEPSLRSLRYEIGQNLQIADANDTAAIVNAQRLRKLADQFDRAAQ